MNKGLFWPVRVQSNGRLWFYVGLMEPVLTMSRVNCEESLRDVRANHVANKVVNHCMKGFILFCFI